MPALSESEIADLLNPYLHLQDLGVPKDNVSPASFQPTVILSEAKKPRFLLLPLRLPVFFQSKKLCHPERSAFHIPR